MFLSCNLAVHDADSSLFFLWSYGYGSPSCDAYTSLLLGACLPTLNTFAFACLQLFKVELFCKRVFFLLPRKRKGSVRPMAKWPSIDEVKEQLDDTRWLVKQVAAAARKEISGLYNKIDALELNLYYLKIDQARLTAESNKIANWGKVPECKSEGSGAAYMEQQPERQEVPMERGAGTNEEGDGPDKSSISSPSIDAASARLKEERPLPEESGSAPEEGSSEIHVGSGHAPEAKVSEPSETVTVQPQPVVPADPVEPVKPVAPQPAEKAKSESGEEYSVLAEFMEDEPTVRLEANENCITPEKQVANEPSKWTEPTPKKRPRRISPDTAARPRTSSGSWRPWGPMPTEVAAGSNERNQNAYPVEAEKKLQCTLSRRPWDPTPEQAREQKRILQRDRRNEKRRLKREAKFFN